ncbi:MAG: Gfo/Idh/MocA family oxidoreductase, partial [Candidatus Kapaibacterium sp.]
MTEIKVGIIGCGHLGKLHIKNIKEIESENENIKFVGLYDTNKSESDNLAVKYNVKSFTTLSELLECINAVFI